MSDKFPVPSMLWPAGHRAALCPIILFDSPSNGVGPQRRVGLDYAPTGFDRLLSVLADVDATATVGVTRESVRFAPTLISRATDMDLEIAPWLADDEFSAGMTSPGDAPGTFGENGLIAGLPDRPVTQSYDFKGHWIVDGSGGDRPTSRGDSCLIPTSPYWVDTAWLDPQCPLPPSSILEAWSLSLADVRTQGAMMTVILHAEVSGRLGISSQILRFLDEVVESGDVWIARGDQIANWWRS